MLKRMTPLTMSSSGLNLHLHQCFKKEVFMELSKVANFNAAMSGICKLVMSSDIEFWVSFARKIAPGASDDEIVEIAQKLKVTAVQRSERLIHVMPYTTEEVEQIVDDIRSGLPLIDVCNKYQRSPGSLLKRLSLNKVVSISEGYYQFEGEDLIRVDMLRKVKDEYAANWGGNDQSE